MTDAARARDLLQTAEKNAAVGPFRELAELQIKLAAQYIKLAELDQNEKLGMNALEIFNRKQFK